MTFLGKILVVVQLVLSVLFVGFAAAVYNYHIKWQERANEVQKELETAQGTIRATHFDAVAQFRPWASQGFFVKGGAGMAFVRNWVDVLGSDSFNEKALSVIIGAGWAFRPTGRFGLQVFGTQHALAMGDLQASEGQIQDVIGNRWSLGAAVVIR